LSGFSLKPDGHLPEDVIEKISEISPNGWTKDGGSKKKSESKKGSGKKGTETRTAASPVSKVDGTRVSQVKSLARDAITALEIPDFKLAAKKLKLAYFVLEPPPSLPSSPLQPTRSSKSLSPTPSPSPSKYEEEKPAPTPKRGRPAKSLETKSPETKSTKSTRRKSKNIVSEASDQNESPSRRSSRLEGQAKSYSPKGLIQQKLLDNLQIQAPKLKNSQS